MTTANTKFSIDDLIEASRGAWSDATRHGRLSIQDREAVTRELLQECQEAGLDLDGPEGQAAISLGYLIFEDTRVQEAQRREAAGRFLGDALNDEGVMQALRGANDAALQQEIVELMVEEAELTSVGPLTRLDDENFALRVWTATDMAAAVRNAHESFTED
ncbi:hypothetical protein ACFO0J_02250 [Castellaniella hirudinis]|uniref:Uncharacterized protein n=1 Tax=Castellaniella hirudinis TaxID=1144617 RepID=A0ABV8RUD1_9BURK